MTHPVLDLPMKKNDAKAKTIRDYLKALLTTLMKEGEGFSGKRPFGNSGWEGELYMALVAGHIVKGSIDDDGYLDECDRSAADKIILKAIEDL